MLLLFTKAKKKPKKYKIVVVFDRKIIVILIKLLLFCGNRYSAKIVILRKSLFHQNYLNFVEKNIVFLQKIFFFEKIITILLTKLLLF